jgi:hypothetical protein
MTVSQVHAIVGICAGGAGRGGIIQPASAGRGPDRRHERRLDSPLVRQIQAVAGLQPALWARPGLTGDAVAVVIVLRIVARPAPVNGSQVDRARRAVRRCRGMPERHRQRPARQVLDDRVEESGKGKRTNPAMPTLKLSHWFDTTDVENSSERLVAESHELT